LPLTKPDHIGSVVAGVTFDKPSGATASTTAFMIAGGAPTMLINFMYTAKHPTAKWQ
jgi:hypothetical protein